MLKKLFFIFFIMIFLSSAFYPTKKENTKLFDFCYSLEKILAKNSIKTKRNLSKNVKSIATDIAKFGVGKTRGTLVKQMINKYKKSKDIFFITIIHSQIYCLVGYWVEKIKPGTFELIFYEKSKKSIEEIKELKNEADKFINDINFEYQNIRKEFNNLFDKKLNKSF